MFGLLTFCQKDVSCFFYLHNISEELFTEHPSAEEEEEEKNRQD